MNVAKNMEFIFVAALVVAVSVSNAFAAPAASATVAAKAASKAPIATVVVVGKRLTAAQKLKRI
jgi:hypothetical protein